MWIVVSESDTFCTRQPDLHPWNPVSESRGHHKAENTDNLSDYQCFRQGRFISQVEPEVTGLILLISLIIFIFQNTVRQLVSDFKQLQKYNFFRCKSSLQRTFFRDTGWLRVSETDGFHSVHNSNSFFNRFTVLSETLVSLATFR